MQLMLVMAYSLLLFLATITEANQQSIDAPEAAADALAQVDQYRAFMFAASEYMRTGSPAPGSYDWSSISQASAVAPGMSAMPMPQGWRVVRSGDGSWATCTEMSEQAAAAIAQWMPSDADNSAAPRTTPVQIGTTNFIVMDTAGAASSLAALCNI